MVLSATVQSQGAKIAKRLEAVVKLGRNLGEEEFEMLKETLCAAAGLALLAASGAGAWAAGVAAASRADVTRGMGTLITRAHDVDEARDTLEDRGYYDINLERASLPYSFNACKRGRRFHIHVNWYGDFVQVDELGPCHGDRDYDDDDYDRRRGDHASHRHWRND